MLTLQRGTVVEARDPAGSVQRLDVEVEGERRPAVADTALVGPAEAGDEVVVNVAARDLGLGSGGFDVVHVNLSRGLSETVRELKARGLIDGHLTAGAAYGGDGEAISTPGAIHHAAHDLGWDAVLCGPGPGILGSGSRLGHGGMAALDTVHAALALGAPTLVLPRMSSGDDRARHRGLSHHAETVLSLLLEPVVVAAPEGWEEEGAADARHHWRRAPVDLDGYRVSGLPASTMGRGLDDDALFFAAAVSGGRVLAGMIESA